MKVYSLSDFRELATLPLGTIYVFQSGAMFGVEIAGVARLAECFTLETAQWIAEMAENLPLNVREAIQRFD